MSTSKNAPCPPIRTDSGITSVNATASMYPAPSAIKQCRKRRGQSRRTTNKPPSKFPAAATTPSPAAIPTRTGSSGFIWSAAVLPPLLRCKNRQAVNYEQVSRFDKQISAPSVSELRALCVKSFSFLSRMPKQNHITFLHYILPPLQPHLRLLPRCRHAPSRQQIIPPHHFRANKSLLDIAVNLSRRFRRRSSFANRPSPHFRLTRRKKLNQPHQVISRANQSVQPRLLQSIRSQQLRRFLLLHLRQLRLEPSANRHHRRILPPFERPQLVPLDRCSQLRCLVIPQIQHVQHRPLRQKQKSTNRFALLRSQLQFPQGLLCFQMRLAFLQRRFLQFQRRLPLLLQILFQLLQPPHNLVVIRQKQLQIQIRSIPQRINAPRRMRHARILKNANHMRNRVHVAQRGQRIPRALLLHPAQVHILHRGISNLLRVVQLGEFHEPRLRHLSHAHMRSLRSRFPLDVRLRQYPKQRRLPNLPQPNNSRLHKPEIVAHTLRSLTRSQTVGKLLRSGTGGSGWQTCALALIETPAYLGRGVNFLC